MELPLPITHCLSHLGLATVFLWLGPAAFAVDVGTRHALLIGVGHYQSEEFDSLPGAEPDAQVLAQVLSNQRFNTEHVTLMTGLEGAIDPRRLPTAAKVRKQLKRLAQIQSPNVLVIVALAGHGLRTESGEYCFCPQDAKLHDPSRLISLSEVYEALSTCGAQRKILLVDACRQIVRDESGSTYNQVNSDGLQSTSRFTSIKSSNLPEPPAHTAVFLSCLPGEVAYERHDDGVTHGVFFSAVIRGLQGGAERSDGHVTVPDLERFVKKEVESYVWSTYHAFQHPVVRNNTDGVFPIVSFSAGDRQMAHAHALLLRGQDASAEAIVDQWLKQNPDDAFALATRAKILAQSGESNHDQGKLDQALRLCLDAVALAPARSEVHLVLAAVHRIRGDVDEAMAASNRAIELDPKNCLAFVERSAIKCMQEDLDGAQRDIETAVALDERHPLVRTIHGAVLFAAGKTSEAFAALERGLAHSPDVPALHFMKGYMLDQQGEYDKAIMAYTAAWRLNPRDVDVLCRRAVSLAHAGDFPAAYADISAAQRLYPNNPDVPSTRIVVLCAEKKFQMAIEELTQLIERQPNFAAWYQIRSTLLQQVGRAIESQQDLKKYESLIRSQE